MKQVESAWNRMNQSDETVMKHVESGWITMKQFVAWSWNTVKHVESGWIMVMKHLESGWNSVFHDHETPWIRDGDHRDIYILILIFDSWCFMVFHCAVSCSFIVLSGCFMLFHCCLIAGSCSFIAVSCCFIAVSLLFHCCFMLFQGVSLLCFILFHVVSSLCFMVFQGVSLPCFILFHDHETDAVGTSLKSNTEERQRRKSNVHFNRQPGVYFFL